MPNRRSPRPHKALPMRCMFAAIPSSPRTGFASTRRRSAQIANRPCISIVCSRWGPDVLRAELPGLVPTFRRLRRQDFRGSKPADIPVEQPFKFDLVFNSTTAKALGLTIPKSFLVRVTEMIESSRVLWERVMDHYRPFLEKQMGHKHYGHVPRLGKIAIWQVSIAIACGLILYLAVWTKLIQ